MKTNFINLIMAGKAMKNTGRSPRVVRGSSEGRQTRFARFAAMLLMLVTMSVGQAWAGNFTKGSTLYLDLNGTNWGNDGATIVALFYYADNASWCYETSNAYKPKETLSTGTSTTHVGGNIYSVTVPNADVKEMYFIRKSGSTVWNYSAKMKSDEMGSNNCVKLSGWDNSSSWSTYAPATEYTIYFKNTVGWSNVYVHFYGSSYSMDSNGASGSKAVANKGAMTSIDGTYYSLTFTSSTAYTKVCFTKDQQDSYGNFWQTEASYSDALNLSSANLLYIPDPANPVTKNNNVPYYSGSWSTYPEVVVPTYSITYECNGATSGCPSSVASATNLPSTLPTPVKSGYTFGGWYTNSGLTSAATAGAKLTANTTLYAKWTETEYNIYVYGRFGISDGAGNMTYTGSKAGDWSTNSTNIKFTKAGDYYKLETHRSVAELKANAGDNKQYFHFKEGDTEYGATSKNIAPGLEGDKKTIQSGTNNFVFDETNANGDDVVLWLDWKSEPKKFWYSATAEQAYTVTINNGDHGTVSPNGEKQVGTSGLSITATPAAGYAFANWAVTGGAAVASATSATTTLTATAAGTVTANYTEDLATGYCLRGFGDFTNNKYYFMKKTGESTGTVGYYELELTAGNHTFKVYNGTWYGNNGTMTRSSCTGWTMSSSDGNCTITADVAGTYIFAFDTNTKKLSVTYPAEPDPTITFGATTESASNGTVVAQVNSENILSGASFAKNTVVTLTATPKAGYYLRGWYGDAAGSSHRLAYANAASNYQYEVTLSSSKTVYAKFEAIPTGIQFDGTISGNDWNNCKASDNGSNPYVWTFGAATNSDKEFCIKNSSCGDTPLLKANTEAATYAATGCTVDPASNGNYRVNNNEEKVITITVTYGSGVHVQVDAAAETKYAVTLAAEQGGSVTFNHDTEVAAGSNTTIQLGATQKSIIATPAAGYMFAGWVVSGTSANVTINHPENASTHMKATGAGAIVTAKFTEDLHTGWYLTGINNWDKPSEYEFMKKTGESAGTIAYVSVNLSENKSFKIYNNANGTEYANKESGSATMTRDNCTDWTFNSASVYGNETGLDVDVAGTYIFKLDYSTQKVSVTYPCEPTSYELWHKDKGPIAVFNETGKANEYDLTFELHNDIINNLYIKDDCGKSYGSSIAISPGNSITVSKTPSTFNFQGAAQNFHWHFIFNSSTKVLSCDAKSEEDKEKEKEQTVQAVYYIYKGTTLALPAGNTYTVTASEPAYYYNTLTESTEQYSATDALTISGNNITGNTLGKYTLSYSGGTTIIYVYRYYVKFPWGACNGIEKADFNRKWKWAAMDASAWNGTTFTVTGLWAEETKADPKANIGWDYYYDWDGRYRYDGEGTSVLFPGKDEQGNKGQWAESYADGVVNWNTNAKDHGGSNYLPLTPLLGDLTCGVNYIDVTYNTTVPASGTTAPTTGGNFTEALSSKIEEITYYTLTYGAKPDAAGIVTHNATGDKVAAETVVTFTAVGESGSHFVGWYSDAECTNEITTGVSGNHYQVTVSADVTAYAKFESNIVYFKKTNNWEHVYAYAWNGDGTDKNAAWPGEPMTAAGTFDCVDYYSYVLPKDYAHIIFNNKDNGSQTGNIEITSTDYGKCWNGTEWVAMPTASTPYTITYTPTRVTIDPMPATATCGDEINFTVTPEAGYVITAVTMNGEDVAHDGNTYTFTMPAEDVMVVATAVSSQAGWYLGYKAAEQGEHSTWNEEILTDNGNGTFSITKELPKGSEYQYKILKKDHAGVTISAEIYSNGGTMTAGNCTGWTFSTTVNECCRIATTIDGNYVFTFTESDKKVSVTYPVISGAATAYTNDGVASGVKSQNTDIMIQGFYWEFDGTAKNSEWLTPYGDTKWTTLTSQAQELAKNFSVVWLPASAVSADRMGYLPINYSDQTSDWGTKAELQALTTALKTYGSHPVADIVVNHMGNDDSACEWPAQNFDKYGNFKPNWMWIPNSDELFHAKNSSDAFGSYPDGIKDQITGCQYDPADTRLFGDNYKIGNTDTYWSRAEMNCIYARDLAHDKDSVRMMVRSYLTWMRNEMGFDGWRFDFAKGINAKYITNYIEHTQPYFAVCESFDGSEDRILPVLEQAGYKTYMFDFLTKKDVINIGIGKGQYTNIRMHGLIAQEYKGRKINRYAVTFVENHDTFRENPEGDYDDLKNMSREGNKFDNSNNKIIQANAYILTMPGVPCVFYPHWAEFKDPIKAIINARRMTGVHSESTVTDESADGKYIARIWGTDGDIWLKLGPNSGYDVVPTYEEAGITYKYTTAYVGENCGVYYHPTAQNPAKPEVEIISLTHPNDWYIGNTAKIQALTNIPNATYTWWVKLPGTDNFIELTNHDGTIDYLLSGEGTYTFKVTATHGKDVSATDEKEFTVDAVAYFIKYEFDGDHWEDRLMTKQEDGVYTYYESGKSRFGYDGAESCANVHMFGKPDGDCKIPANPNNIDLSGTGVEVVFVYNPATDILTIYNLADGMYRIMSSKGGKTYYSNTVSADATGAKNQPVSFFAYADGSLTWQKFDGNAWSNVPGGTITNSITTDQVWQAKSGITGGTTLADLKKYTGSYYIFSSYTSQTETVAAGKMSSFNNTNDPTEYFNNYWVKYVEAKTDAAATVGNSINHNLAIRLNDYVLPDNTNLRYAYNSTTNYFGRAFLSGSSTDKFLMAYGQNILNKETDDDAEQSNPASWVKFSDASDWMYIAYVNANTSNSQDAQIRLAAYYNGSWQYLLSSTGNDDSYKSILGHVSTNTTENLPFMVAYDYKTNRIIAAWNPTVGDTIKGNLTVDADMIVLRDADSKAKPDMFVLQNGANVNVIRRLIFALQMERDKLVYSNNTYKNGLRSQLFQVCLPYNVKMGEISGLSDYNTNWHFQVYYGEKRAQTGWQTGISDFWYDMGWSKNTTLQANRGYVVYSGLQYSDYHEIGTGKYEGDGDAKHEIMRARKYLFFPSETKAEGWTIDGVGSYSTTTYAQIACTIDGREKVDSDWRLTGVPGWFSAKMTAPNPANGWHSKTDANYQVSSQECPNWLYEWCGEYGRYALKFAPDYALNPTSAYMMQYHGTVGWTAAAYNFDNTPVSESVGARKMARSGMPLSSKYCIEIGGLYDMEADQAYVLLEADGSDDYVIGADMSKISSSQFNQIYSVTAGYELAANVVADTTTHVALGLNLPESGNYTISLSSMTMGAAVPYLYDAELDTYTDLSAQSYEFSAIAGQHQTGRFSLVFGYQAPQAPTDIQNIASGELSAAVVNGKLVISGATNSNVALYDAAGRMMYEGKISGNAIPAPAAAGVYMLKCANKTAKVVIR